jgi:hypothetical protein
MKAQIAKKWIKALRSGEYKKTNKYLRTKRGFCVLGVLCDLYAKQHNIQWNFYSKGKFYTLLDSWWCLPTEVVLWGNMLNKYGIFLNEENKKIALDKENDKGKSFLQLADLIEKNIERL